MFEAVKKEELLAIPFFVLAGNIMTQGTIADRLVALARAVMGKTPGGLGIATIFACVIFAAISGSSPVTVIAVGSIMFPMLVEERYPENYSLGVLTSAGSLGIIIPPSVPMIIYAIMVSNQDFQVSPNDLFIAGVLPGLFIASVLVIYTMYQTRPDAPGNNIRSVEYEGSYGANVLKQLKRSILSLMLPVMILGGIYGVLGPLKFTVTEAAAVAVVYALFVELFLHREMSIRRLPKILADSGVMMGSLFLIIVLAIAFNKFLSEQMVPQAAAEWLQTVVSTKWQFIILCNLFLLALGCVMEIISAILIVAPLLAPIAVGYGMDPIHFGIMFIVNLELGYLTPPMGVNLFVSSTVFNRDILSVIKATAPFLLMMLFCLGVIAWFEDLSLFLLR
jgi:C4-dicarboxylate transporter DctM subunit